MIKFLFIFLFFLPAIARADEAASIVLKAMIVNPSDGQSQMVPVELPLPREAGKKDVVGMTEGLKVVFDSEQGVYKAVGEIPLKAGEEKRVEVRLADIWRIPEKDVRFQKGYLPSLLKSLEGTKYADTAGQLAETIQERLDDILARQNKTVAPSKHIEIYRENLSVMNDIKKDVRTMEKLSAEKDSTVAEALETEEGGERKGTPSNEIPVITLKMRVQNPSATEKALLPVDYFLPPEVQEADVINAGGLDVHYDLNRGAVYLHKDEVELAPGESKVYEIVLRDLWRVEPEKVQELEVKAAGIASGLEGTQFQKSAVKLQEEIEELAKEIAQSQDQAQKQPIEDRIDVFMESMKMMAQMQDKMTAMAQLKVVSSTSPETTPETMGMESQTQSQSQSESQAEAQKEAAVSEKPGKKGPTILVKTLFEGKAPDETTVWRVILGIVAFLGFVSLMFYLIWWIQVKTGKVVEEEGAE